jgi:DNA-binding GntR family transcriptional regulator
VLPQVGCRVVKPSRTEINDFFFVLSKIDGSVASLAAERHSEEEGRQLSMIRPPSEIDMLDNIMHRKSYISYIGRFHDQIWKMARAPLLQAQFYNLHNLSSFYLWQGLPKLAPSAAKQLINERDEIAQAILNRDAKSAAMKMEEHVLGKPDLVGVSG